MPTKTPPVAALGEVREVPIYEVREYGANPRKIPTKAVEQTAKSIRDFGWQQPLVVDAESVLIVGHVRLAAAKSLGLEAVPVIVADLTPDQARAYRIADNRAGDYTGWDYSLLIEELDGLGTAYADTLDLADWTALLKEFEAQGGTGTHDLPDDTGGPLTGTGYTVSVEFATQAEADTAGPALLQVPGVINVRHGRHNETRHPAP